MTPAALMTWDYSIVNWLFKGLFFLKSLGEARSGSSSTVTDDKVQKRIDLGADARKDFMTYVSHVLFLPRHPANLAPRSSAIMRTKVSRP